MPDGAVLRVWVLGLVAVRVFALRVLAACEHYCSLLVTARCSSSPRGALRSARWFLVLVSVRFSVLVAGLGVVGRVSGLVADLVLGSVFVGRVSVQGYNNWVSVLGSGSVVVRSGRGPRRAPRAALGSLVRAAARSLGPKSLAPGPA